MTSTPRRWATIAALAGLALAGGARSDSLEERLEAAAGRLGSIRFGERERAHRELHALVATSPVRGVAWLRQRLTGTQELEARWRLERLLELLGAERWRRLPPSPIVPRFAYAAARTRHGILVWGGDAGRGRREAVSDGALFDPARWTWKRLSPSPLSPRRDAQAWVVGERVLLWGGNGGTAPDWQEFADGAWYDPARDAWERIPAPGAGDVSRPLGLWTGRQLLVCVDRVGGGPWRGWLREPASGRWRDLPGPPGSGPMGWMGRERFAWGDHVLLREAVLDPAAGAWRPLPAPPPMGFRPSLFWTGTKLVAVGDGGRKVAVLRPARKGWLKLPPAPVRAEASAHLLDPGRLLFFAEQEAAVLDLERGSWSVLPRPPGKLLGQSSWVGRVGDEVLFLSGFLDGRDGLRLALDRPVWKTLVPSGIDGPAHCRPFFTPRGVFYWGGLTDSGAPHEAGAWLELAGGALRKPEEASERPEDE